MKMRTFLRSHGPPHQPKTYTEQLRELNPHPHADSASMKTKGRTMHPSGNRPLIVASTIISVNCMRSLTATWLPNVMSMLSNNLLVSFSL